MFFSYFLQKFILIKVFIFFEAPFPYIVSVWDLRFSRWWRVRC